MAWETSNLIKHPSGLLIIRPTYLRAPNAWHSECQNSVQVTVNIQHLLLSAPLLPLQDVWRSWLSCLTSFRKYLRTRSTVLAHNLTSSLACSTGTHIAASFYLQTGKRKEREKKKGRRKEVPRIHTPGFVPWSLSVESDAFQIVGLARLADNGVFGPTDVHVPDSLQRHISACISLIAITTIILSPQSEQPG